MDWHATRSEWSLFLLVPFSLFPAQGSLLMILASWNYMFSHPPKTKTESMMELHIFWCLLCIGFPSFLRLGFVVGIVFSCHVLHWNLLLDHIVLVAKNHCSQCQFLICWLWFWGTDWTNFFLIGLAFVYCVFSPTYDANFYNPYALVPFQRLLSPHLQPNVYNQLQFFVARKILDHAKSKDSTEQMKCVRLSLLLLKKEILAQKRRPVSECRTKKKHPSWFLYLGIFLQGVFFTGYNVNPFLYQAFFIFQISKLFVCLLTYPQMKLLHEIVDCFELWEPKRPWWEMDFATWNGDALFHFVREIAFFRQVDVLQLRITQYKRLFWETMMHLDLLPDLLISIVDYSFGFSESHLPIVDYFFIKEIERLK